MYLSALLINLGNNPDRPRPGRLWLRNLYRVHQRLSMAFPSDEQKSNDPDFLQPFNPDNFKQQLRISPTEKAGFLFRVDVQPGGRAVILVQSALEPDWEYAFHNARHFLASPPECKTYVPHFNKNQYLRFRLRANPTVRRVKLKDGTCDDRKNRPRHALYELEDQVAWLARQGALHGFELSTSGTCDWFETDNRCAKYDVTVRDEGTIYTGRKAKDGDSRHHSVLFEGHLRVTEETAFVEALRRGIGPAKTFGFGLLSVARIGIGSIR